MLAAFRATVLALLCLVASSFTTRSQRPFVWSLKERSASNPYRSRQFFDNDNEPAWQAFLADCSQKSVDPFWEQIKVEAQDALTQEPDAGPQIYQGILSQPSLLEAVCTVVSHDIETELIPATEIRNLFFENLTPDDQDKIRLDLQAVGTRSPSTGDCFRALLFHNGFHALVGYRLGHRLWQAGRTSLAYYMQSTISRTYSADIHPACRMGSGIYIRVGGGVVIGETAVVGDDTSILEGVTLGGTGKESGDRHPKVGNGVVIRDGGTVLGNIVVGDGSVVDAKSIVTKPVPPLATVSGVPASVTGYRKLEAEEFTDDLEQHLVDKYLEEWTELSVPSSE